MRSGVNRAAVVGALVLGSLLVTVRGYLTKAKSCAAECKANGRDVTFADGPKLTLAGANAASQAAGDAFRNQRLGR